MDLSIPLKLILAAVLGGIIGIEREKRDKPAGLRTNIMICVGSTLLMIISIRVAADFGGEATRIAAQIVAGVGFLGAGAVLHAHGSVVGLTTAATIWVVSGVGMALGSAMYGTAVIVTALSIVTLHFLGMIQNRIPQDRSYRYSLIVNDLSNGLPAINRVLRDCSIPEAAFNLRKTDDYFNVWFNLKVPAARSLTVTEQLSRVPEVVQVETSGDAGDSETSSKSGTRESS
jgi:putative Mg2+ transporter-C (MgtC) family protein